MEPRLFIPEFLPELRRGAGEGPQDGGCVLQVSDYLWRGRWSDSPICVLPALRSIAIRVNDHTSTEDRQQLWPLIPRLSGTGHTKWEKMKLQTGKAVWVEVEDREKNFTTQQKFIPYLLDRSLTNPAVCIARVDEYRSEFMENFASCKTLEGQMNMYIGWEYAADTPQDLAEILDEYDRMFDRKAKEIPAERWAELEKVFSGKEVRVTDGSCSLVTH